MKKIICLVLIFTMMLTACSKWNVEIVDPTKPSEKEAEIVASESELTEVNEEKKQEEQTEQPYEAKKVDKYEAESFFYSEEGYEDMAFFAGWLGTKTFESTEEFVSSESLYYFMDKLYGTLGEEAMYDDEVFLQIPRELGDKYLLKFFGVDYEPKEDEFNFDSETGDYKVATFGGGIPNALLSYDNPRNIEENRFSVKMLLLVWQDELGKQFVSSEMVFDVMEDDDGKFLRLVSNEASEPFRKASFEMQAQSLTRQMLQVMNKKNFEEENILISNGFAGNFMMQAAVFVNASNGFDKYSPYVGSFGKISGYTYYLPVKEMKRIAFEVFGIEDFQYGFNSNFEYDSENEWFLTGFEWGMGSGYNAKNMVTTIFENIYSVEFTLLYYGASSEGDPELMEGDRYIMDFELIDGEFLRYAGFKKAAD